jgi:hypothetical protein
MGWRRKRPLIFISYRRNDTPNYAGRVFDTLNSKRRFRDRVFRDVYTLRAGNFVKHIEEEIGQSYVLIALIGEHWLVDAQGRRRLDDPGDYVRLELETALAHRVTVIPVLMEGAQMPAATELPESLKELPLQNALPLNDERWDYDTQRLAELLKEEIGKRRSLSNILGRLWRRLREPLAKRLGVLLLTLVVPDALIIGGLTRWVALYYYEAGGLEYILTRPPVFIQLAALQAVAVFAFSYAWMILFYPWLRRGLEGPPDADAGGDEPQGTPRKE